ncbi:hypothetical protein G7B40_031240 [Aetokthonos hydrillicola Thurmond2011]|jgi:hypothetical protein|uniref:Uncharacterized protein n=1 Tax=Aetokthonos hydrillicola Thurmond2011 TaxID=2712845 RepID=A0AAP5MB94_9CYAN|nr:hypothetical protein [Aetokthonos hydrillicola]MBO3463217.1 hypothetical protein [Aetokthonos hydrillicola CCALA 1050]MBW4590526.1 hypothetical protein [Aetokthonos hydrillicola CCALA 1050]MDR9899000.1 hypothetical protein [Aetokthonos hydrillicola Thurmond2011]
MEPVTLTAVATAIATIVLTKSLEKVGENLGGVAWEKSIDLVKELRQKNQLPLLMKSVEGNEQQRLDYGQAVLELKKAADTDPEIAQKVIEVEAAAKADPKLAPEVQKLENEINSQPAIIINSSKLAESIKNLFQGNTFYGGQVF